MESVVLGRSGLTVSRLCGGTGTNGYGGSSEQTALGLEGLSRLLRAALDRGVNFWDAADGYGSHPHVARALKGLSRDQVVVATKTTSRTAERVDEDLARFMRELGTDVLDIVLLHCMQQEDWPTQCAGAMDALSRAKERGMVRAVGVSCHSLEALRVAADSAWVDVALVRINHAGTSMDGSPPEVVPLIERLYAAGIGVYAMKVYGVGKLVDDPRRAMGYVLSLGTVHALNIGTSSLAQLRENAALMEELSPLHPLCPQGGLGS